MSERTRQWLAVQTMLRGQMTRATADHLLGGATLIEAASGPRCWTVQVRHPASRAWLASPHWAERVAEAAAYVTGRTTQVRFIVYSNSPGVGEAPLPPQEGDFLMQHDKRVRVISHMTRSAFLHVEDALSIGKLRLFAGSYRKGQGAEALLVHYLDVPDARVVLRALADAVPGYQYREYKGGTLAGGRAVSRVLTVQAREEKLFVELAHGPGTLTATGAVTPSRVADAALPHETVTVVFSLHQAQRLAEEALAYLGAWDLVR
ncbi:MAG: hypothetical protein H0T73_02585, partial [Ardenticatenales bacterium]|nr:hypothetical protein [Ardenticatenales bacterium]